MNAGGALVCRELRLRQFRNFTEIELDFPPEGVAIIGDNGSGKTNLLEAIYYLEIFRSFRGAPDEQLVRFGMDAFHVRGRLVRTDPTTGEPAGKSRMLTVEAGYEAKGKRKRVAVDGGEAERLGDAIGHVGAVVFSPSDVAIVSGAPAERRRFLDILLSLNTQGYLPALQRYRQVLRQRNAMLKANARPALLEPWDEQLSDWGTKLTVARARWTREHAADFTSRYRAIGGGRAGEIGYSPGTPAAPDEALDPARMRVRFSEGLARVSPRERERGVTLIGPHRDDLAITIEGPDGAVDLRDFGSGGQVRTAAIALRMLEAESVRATRERAPLLLLDDVFAELDAGRSLRILELLQSHPGQVIMTAPKQSDVQLRRAGSDGFVPMPLAQWRIEGGKVFA